MIGIVRATGIIVRITGKVGFTIHTTKIIILVTGRVAITIHAAIAFNLGSASETN
jgi:hypothetical protein